MNKTVLNVVLCIVLFLLGVWVFNHFPFPMAGIIIAFAYPLFLLFQYMKGKEL